MYRDWRYRARTSAVFAAERRKIERCTSRCGWLPLSSISYCFASEHTCSNDPCELAGVVTRVGGVGAAHAKKVEHGCLWFEYCTATDGTDFNGWHGHRDLERTVEAVILLALH